MLGSYLCLKYEGEVPSSFVDVKELSDKHKLPKVKFTHDGASMKAGLKYDRLIYGHRIYKKVRLYSLVEMSGILWFQLTFRL